MEIVRSIVIDKHIDDVFEFVSDPMNDPRWCPKVLYVEQVEGDGPGPGSRWDVVHRPIRLRPPRRMSHSCVGWDPPHRIEWLEDDGDDMIEVMYELEEVWTSTRLTQRDHAQLGAPRLLQPVVRAGIGRDIEKQLRELRRLLERS